ncbi:hypothetical protein [Loigolactobacillus iwatensis]|nr:hypothetical protein [Loigolactobacillus iwatensis]
MNGKKHLKAVYAAKVKNMTPKQRQKFDGFLLAVTAAAEKQSKRKIKS